MLDSLLNHVIRFTRSGWKLNMNLNTFWELIERSREDISPEVEHDEALVERLVDLEVKEVIEFERCFFNCMYQAYRNDLWMACYLLSGGYASDDGFKDFRSYLISRGRDVFEKAVNNPDSLDDLVPREEVAPEYESFAYSASKAYHQKTGSYFDEDEIDVQIHPEGFIMWELTNPADEPLTFADSETVLPRLRRRFEETMRLRIATAKASYESPDPEQRSQAIWDFYHFAAHSADALEMLNKAAKDESPEVQKRASKYLEWCQRDAGNGH